MNTRHEETFPAQRAALPVEEQDPAVVAHVAMHDGPGHRFNSTGSVTTVQEEQRGQRRDLHLHSYITDDVLGDGRLQ